ncbi:MAG: response regulator [Drouetiella hepatica Uher 2000/2452]|jgi:CheY-like chemotaxis protein|uniref:Response regulator n=1 Tax=Drouetiella hepatica Uher 2000/2452 TaxID=904376 RepID=A0A951QIA4_9CYAN|nr:response regulator [Drouetiella hepatica Uher 2000/2452]
MLTPSFIQSSQHLISTCQIESPDKLVNHLQSCGQKQFTGQLEIKLLEIQSATWHFFFRLGRLVWASSEVHSIRRWCRQLTQHCPTLPEFDVKTPLHHWNYDALAELVRQRQLPHEQMSAIIQGNVVEILFDLIQHWHQHRQAKVQLCYKQLVGEAIASAPVLIRAEPVCQQVKQAWETWQQTGLGHLSPNLAPVIWDTEELRRQVSLLAYHNLTTLVTGDLTFRDLGVKLKQNPLSLTRSILPYVQQEIMGFVTVKDLNYSVRPPISPLSHARSSSASKNSPLVVNIDDSRFDHLAMNQILSQAGCRFINVRDPVQALPILLEQKPDLIFLDLLMPVTNGYEVCAQIRRISVFKDTPVIIVTASDGIVDRVRAKLVGSTGFISKPIESEKVMPILQQYLAIAPSSHSQQSNQVWSPSY